MNILVFFSIISTFCHREIWAKCTNQNVNDDCITAAPTEKLFNKRKVAPKEEKRHSTSKCQSREKQQDLSSLVQLIRYLAARHLYRCVTAILYDGFFEKEHHRTLEELLRSYPLAYIHGQLDERKKSTLQDAECRDLLVLGHDLETAARAVGNQDSAHVVLVAAPGTSRFTVLRFLASPRASPLVNLLVLRQDGEEIHLYTHRVYVDGLGSSEGHIVTTWRCGRLTRPHVHLFDARKFRYGLGGHRFLVATGAQPPFVLDRGDTFKGGSKNAESSWDGVEIRVLWLMSEMLNFTLEFHQPPGASDLAEAGDAVIKELLLGRADLGVGSLYMLPERMNVVTMSPPHSQDCATFMTLASIALPKYRAIMGPFHWTVWLALTSAYILAIFPLAFSASHSLKHLLSDPWEIENMFWYVFGTFTNCFTFRGKHSWSHADKSATRMLIGWYWVFTIIVTACYTGSIIAFVTLPVFPEIIDNSQQILEQGFLVGMLGKGGWQDWFSNSSDPVADSLMKKMEYLPDVHSAFVNVTQRYYYYRGYAFLGSQHLLRYFIVANHTKKSSKSLLHLGAECFVPFNVGLAFPKRAPYSDIMGNMLLRIVQHGFIQKLTRDMEWSMKSDHAMKVFATPSLNIVRTVERKLTLEDVQGMFLLLAAGFAIAFFALFVEINSWAFKKMQLRFSAQKRSQLGYKQDESAKGCSIKSLKKKDRKGVDVHAFSLQNYRAFQKRPNRLQHLIRGPTSSPSNKVSHYKRPHSTDDYLIHKNSPSQSKSVKHHLNKHTSKDKHQLHLYVKPSGSKDGNGNLPPEKPRACERHRKEAVPLEETLFGPQTNEMFDNSSNDESIPFGNAHYHCKSF